MMGGAVHADDAISADSDAPTRLRVDAGDDGSAVGISVIMPAHNEEDLLAAAVTSVVVGLRRATATTFEVLVVENGSSDATPTIAKHLESELAEVTALTSPHADYGRALRAGFLAATGRVVVNFDVDYIDLAFLARAATLVAQDDGPVVVVGAKRGAGAHDERALPRRVVTFVFSSLLRYGFALQVPDTHGMKALRRVPLLPIVESCQMGTDLFDTEMILRAERAGLATSSIPVAVEELRPSRSPIASRIPRTLKGLAKLRIVLWREAPRRWQTPKPAATKGRA